MDQCRTNQYGGRNYYKSCSPYPRQNMPASMPAAAGGCKREENLYAHVDKMPLAMAYVPWQNFHTTYEPCKALCMGTIFPELCKPFCGKRGKC